VLRDARRVLAAEATAAQHRRCDVRVLEQDVRAGVLDAPGDGRPERRSGGSGSPLDGVAARTLASVGPGQQQSDADSERER
jgi:hypothetical protein